MRHATVAGLCAALLVAACGGAGSAERRNEVVRVVEASGPAVVNIATERVVRRRVGGFMRFGDDLFDRAFEDFFGNAPRWRNEVHNSIGSGFIFDESGYCLTNEHVIRKASTISVRLSDGRRFPAKPVALDPENDLAILKIDADARLPRLEFQSGDGIFIGETVIAIGNPFGLENTVTTGVVSGTGRAVAQARGENFKDLIQTDAAINPGNSGGPLLSIEGKILGVNTAIRADAEGIGFAIPTSKVRAFIRRALPGPGDIPKLGFGIEKSPGGVRVSWADADCPLKQGDEISKVAGVRGRPTVESAAKAVRKPGGKGLAVTVVRDGKKVAVDLDLAPLADAAPLEWRGLKLECITPKLVASLSLAGTVGAVVSKVEKGSVADKLGARSGDVVRQVNRIRISSLADMRKAVKLLGAHRALVVFQRGGKLFYGILEE